jgi:hypothetical protein
LWRRLGGSLGVVKGEFGEFGSAVWVVCSRHEVSCSIEGGMFWVYVISRV